MNPEELLSHASQFDFEFERTQGQYKFKDLLSINLRSNENGKKRWAICYHGNCWDDEIKQFIYEPSPSNREDGFLVFTRFSLKHALEIANKLMVDGW